MVRGMSHGSFWEHHTRGGLTSSLAEHTAFWEDYGDDRSNWCTDHHPAKNPPKRTHSPHPPLTPASPPSLVNSTAVLGGQRPVPGGLSGVWVTLRCILGDDEKPGAPTHPTSFSTQGSWGLVRLGQLIQRLRRGAKVRRRPGWKITGRCTLSLPSIGAGKALAVELIPKFQPWACSIIFL